MIFNLLKTFFFIIIICSGEQYQWLSSWADCVFLGMLSCEKYCPSIFLCLPDFVRLCDL
jgi:hypothetical protein